MLEEACEESAGLMDTEDFTQMDPQRKQDTSNTLLETTPRGARYMQLAIKAADG